MTAALTTSLDVASALSSERRAGATEEAEVLDPHNELCVADTLAKAPFSVAEDAGRWHQSQVVRISSNECGPRSAGPSDLDLDIT